MKNYKLATILGAFLTIALITTSATIGKANPADNNKTIKVKQAFPFLNKYLTLPANVKDGFKLVYSIRANPAPLPEMHYVHNNRRTRIMINSDGIVSNLPDLALWQNGTIESAGPRPAGMRISITMNSVPIIPLSTNISVSALNNSISDLKEAIKSAGPVALAFPKQESIVFKGVASGTIVFADGRRIPIARNNTGLVFSPLKHEMRGAQSLSFANAPTGAEFAR